MEEKLKSEAFKKYPDETYPVGDMGRPYDPNYKEREAFIKGAQSDYVMGLILKAAIYGFGLGLMVMVFVQMIILSK